MDVFQRHEQTPIRQMAKVEERDDVLMANSADRLRFIQKTLGRRDPITGHRCDHLQGDFAAEDFVPGEIYDAHAPFGDPLDDAISVDDHLAFKRFRVTQERAVSRTLTPLIRVPLTTFRTASRAEIVSAMLCVVAQGVIA